MTTCTVVKRTKVNCGHVMFHFQFQAYRPTQPFAGEFPCNKASIWNGLTNLPSGGRGYTAKGGATLRRVGLHYEGWG